MRALCCVFIFAACGVPPAVDGEWVPWDSIDGALAPEVMSDRPAPPVPDALRVVTFNVHFGADVDGLADALASAPDTAGADVILVQEIEQHPGEDGSRAERLAARLDMNHAYAPARVEGDGTHGLAILSRHPLEGVEVMALPHVDLSFNARDRIAVAADVVLGERRLRVVDVHLDTRANLTDRVRQLHAAVIDLEEPVLVGGDFNTDRYVWVENGLPLPSVSASSGFDQAAGLDDYMDAMGFDAPTADAGATFSAGPLDLRLDSIYTRGVIALDTGVAREVDVSDHQPLWLEVSLP